MSNQNRKTVPVDPGSSLSLDAWALIAAFLLALAVRFDLLHNVPW